MRFFEGTGDGIFVAGVAPAVSRFRQSVPYWIALTAGRLWLGLSGYRVAIHRLLGLAVAGAAGAAAILWVGGPVAPAGLVTAGFALSVVFPLLMLLTPARVGADRAAAAVGWQTAASSIGAAGGPAVAGVVLDRVGIAAYGPVALVMAGALTVTVVALGTGGDTENEALASQSLDT